MTCIAGLVDGDNIYLGGDSATSHGRSITIKANAKVFSVGPFVIGVAGNPRVGQLLQWAFTPPLPTSADTNPYEYMVTDFVDALRSTFRSRGVAARAHEQESIGIDRTASGILVGYCGCLFKIGPAYDVNVASDPLDAIGSGADAARGALYASQGKDPLTRIRLALEAADHFTSSVRCPFTILRLRTYRANPRLEAVECHEIECDFGETEQPQAHEDGAPSSPAA
jgi:ATP-dependent protease HslVU (ClpYQ) peptidase subunit